VKQSSPFQYLHWEAGWFAEPVGPFGDRAFVLLLLTIETRVPHLPVFRPITEHMHHPGTKESPDLVPKSEMLLFAEIISAYFGALIPYIRALCSS
jgi:hypothetical protein